MQFTQKESKPDPAKEAADIEVMFQLLAKKLVPAVRTSASKENKDKKGINVNELKRKAKEAGELADSRKSMSFKPKKTEKRDNEDLDDLDED